MRRVPGTIGSLLLLVSVVMGQNYTLQDVAKHKTASDCWMVLNSNKVYNFSSYISSHPGGSTMVSSCGTDATARFNSVGHSGSAVNAEAPFLIGTLGTTPPPPPPTIAVSIAPTSATVQVGKTQTFTANVTNSTKGVTWSVTGSVGTIANGVFTATAAGNASVTATSVEDTTKTAKATVTVTALPPPPPPPQSIAVSIMPTNPTFKVGTSMTFTASVANSNQGVKWTLTPSGSSVGVINPNGLQATVIAGGVGTATVTASSLEDTSKSASTTITITPADVPVPPPSVSLTSAEVAKHATANDCWIIINGSVYNVTAFIPQHPQNGAAMIPQCGKDATGPFTAAMHSARAMTLLPTFLLGALVTAPPPPPPPVAQQCKVTQQNRQFTVVCNPTTPAIPTASYNCSASVKSSGVTVTCKQGSNHRDD